MGVRLSELGRPESFPALGRPGSGPESFWLRCRQAEDPIRRGATPCSLRRRGAQSFDPPIVLSATDFEQLLQQGEIEQEDETNHALMDRGEFVKCLRQQVRGEAGLAAVGVRGVPTGAGGVLSGAG